MFNVDTFVGIVSVVLWYRQNLSLFFVCVRSGGGLSPSWPATPVISFLAIFGLPTISCLSFVSFISLLFRGLTFEFIIPDQLFDLDPFFGLLFQLFHAFWLFTCQIFGKSSWHSKKI
jgi:hypothetical protein